MLANTTLDPGNLKLNSSCVGHNCITSTGGSSTNLQIYAPAAETVVGGGGDFYGSIVARNMSVTGGSRLHQNNNAGSSYVLANWHEVRN
jgi:hypothetical protein